MNRFKYTLPLLLALICLAALAAFTVNGGAQQTQKQDATQKPKNIRTLQTKESQSRMTPDAALQLLKDGNRRFVEGELENRDFRAQIGGTAAGQYPFAVILSCQDSRASSDLLFDLNKGDAFSLRIAGNIINDDVLGGMEFGTKAAGAKLIAVIGHTKCGAVFGACDNVKLGHLTGLLDKIKPAVNAVPASVQPRTSKNAQFAEMVAAENVRHVTRQIPERSPVIREMVAAGQVKIVGGMYDISTGKVTFYEN